MAIELKPDQQEVLNRAAQSGMSADEVLDQAFAVIREQHRHQEWMIREREAIAAQIAEGHEQAQRGELTDAGEAMRVLRERRAKRRIA